MPTNKKESLDAFFGPPLSTAVGLPGKLDLATAKHEAIPPERNGIMQILSGSAKLVGEKTKKVLSFGGDLILDKFLQTEKYAQHRTESEE